MSAGSDTSATPAPTGIAATVRAVRNGETTALARTEQALLAIRAHEAVVHAFVTVLDEQALEHASEIDRRVAAGEDPGPLTGVTVALKDNLCTRGVATTCSSKILEHWHPPYDATVVVRLRCAGAVAVGKTNLDEFAMGSSTEHSAFGTTRNPYCPERVPGGSSGGSTAAVASGMADVALGSDTGGSIRQPAAFCGVVGMKPTYGAVSRYGLVAFASSLDQIGPLTRTVADAAAVFDVIGGHDPLDSTSLERPAPRLVEALDSPPPFLRVGLVRELIDGADPEIVAAVSAAADVLATVGANIEEVSIPELRHALPAYYLLAPAEASSNLARYDGVRYGMRVDGPDVGAMNAATREAGFGEEVKRRIMLGTFALSAGYYDAYYGQAQRVRTLILDAFRAAYDRFDVLLGATTPSTAFAIGDKIGDPLSMYLSDLFTVPSNLAGHPAISLPFGADADGLPIGVQVLAPELGEAVMLQAAALVEAGAPPLAPPKVTAAGAHA